MAEVKGRALVAIDSCKGCGLCTTACPVGIMVLDESTVNIKGYNPASVSDASQCLGCGNCAQMCPDSAITVERFDRKKGE